MFLVLWEFEVKPGSTIRFEKVYGPSGDWAQLFRVDSNYQGTRLLRDLSRENFYLTIDSWLSQSSYEAFLQSHHDQYKTVDSLCESLTHAERRIGAYEELNPDSD
jgi:hypothetical protein